MSRTETAGPGSGVRPIDITFKAARFVRLLFKEQPVLVSEWYFMLAFPSEHTAPSGLDGSLRVWEIAEAVL